MLAADPQVASSSTVLHVNLRGSPQYGTVGSGSQRLQADREEAPEIAVLGEDGAHAVLPADGLELGIEDCDCRSLALVDRLPEERSKPVARREHRTVELVRRASTVAYIWM